MATHSNMLAWKIPWTEEPRRLQSMGSKSRTQLSNWEYTHRKDLVGGKSLSPPAALLAPPSRLPCNLVSSPPFPPHLALHVTANFLFLVFRKMIQNLKLGKSCNGCLFRIVLGIVYQACQCWGFSDSSRCVTLCLTASSLSFRAVYDSLRVESHYRELMECKWPVSNSRVSHYPWKER